LKCMKCGVEAVFQRLYSGEALCRNHYLRSVEQRVYTAIKSRRMLTPTDTTAVALSGGKDSTALLHILHGLEKRFPKAKLAAVTVDEGIKGYRREALAIARENCARLGVEHAVVSFKEFYGLSLDAVVRRVRKLKSGLTPCAYCGVLRRKALNHAAKRLNASKLATAHNLDDFVQTLLLNIFHGDIYRLARTEPVTTESGGRFVVRIKPLYEVPEAETALYAYLQGIKFQSTPCPYAGTALRSDLRVIVNGMESKHPGIKYTILRTFEKVIPAIKEETKCVELRTCGNCGDPSIGNLCKPCEMLQQINVI